MSDDEAIRMLLPDAKVAIMEDGEVAMQVDGAHTRSFSLHTKLTLFRPQSRSSGSRSRRAFGSSLRCVELRLSQQLPN